MPSIQLTAKAALLRSRYNDVMATRRAYAACLGSGAALVACAALLFVVASAIVAFNGLPGDGGALDPVTVSANASHVPVRSPAATRLAAFAAVAPARAARVRVAFRGTPPHRVAVGGGGTSGGGSTPVPRPVTPVMAAPVGATSATGGPGTGSTVAGLGRTLGSMVTKVTAGASGAIGGGAGRVVGGAGSTAGETVSQVGSLVGGLGGS